MLNINKKINIILAIIGLFLLAWAPWLNDEDIHDRIFQEKAHLHGTMGWVDYPDSTRKYELICDYNVMWAPFGRWVASCEGGYYVTFWNKIFP